MSRSGEELGQLISKLPEFFDRLRSNGVAKGKTGRLKCSRIYQDCRAPTSVRINANLRSRGLPQLFRLKSARRCASRSHDAYVRRYADSDFFSGVVRVTKGDRIIYENAFGYADRGW